MSSFILIYNKEKNFNYTLSSLKKSTLGNCQYIIVVKEDSFIPTLETHKDVVKYSEEKDLSEALNKAVEISNCDTCFIVKSGCYVTNTAIKSLEKNLDDDNVGIVVPKLNSFFENQKYVFQNVFEEAILKSSKVEFQKYNNEKIFSKDIDDNLIAFKKSVFNKLGGFDKNIVGLPIIYKDYLLNNFQNGYNVIVCLDALVYSKSVCDNNLLNSQLVQSLNKKLGFEVTKYDDICKDLIDLINDNPFEDLNIVEVGCLAGYSLMAIKDKYPYANVYGLEIDKYSSKASPPCVELKLGDCMDTIDEFDDDSIDYIICSGTLEYLIDPWEFIKKCRKKLSPSGKFITSISNVSHISVISELLNGLFIYKDSGVLDRDHLRFFTVNTIMRLFAENGYNINQISATRSDDYREHIFIDELSKLNIINKSLQHPLDIDKQYSVLKYNLVCSKVGE